MPVIAIETIVIGIVTGTAEIEPETTAIVETKTTGIGTVTEMAVIATETTVIATATTVIGTVIGMDVIETEMTAIGTGTATSATVTDTTTRPKILEGETVTGEIEMLIKGTRIEVVEMLAATLAVMAAEIETLAVIVMLVAIEMVVIVMAATKMPAIVTKVQAVIAMVAAIGTFETGTSDATAMHAIVTKVGTAVTVARATTSTLLAFRRLHRPH
jgi:hypothetical protein